MSVPRTWKLGRWRWLLWGVVCVLGVLGQVEGLGARCHFVEGGFAPCVGVGLAAWVVVGGLVGTRGLGVGRVMDGEMLFCRDGCALCVGDGLVVLPVVGGVVGFEGLGASAGVGQGSCLGRVGRVVLACLAHGGWLVCGWCGVRDDWWVLIVRGRGSGSGVGRGPELLGGGGAEDSQHVEPWGGGSREDVLVGWAHDDCVGGVPHSLLGLGG